jgi:hypothetical protein
MIIHYSYHRRCIIRLLKKKLLNKESKFRCCFFLTKLCYLQSKMVPNIRIHFVSYYTHLKPSIKIYYVICYETHL